MGSNTLYQADRGSNTLYQADMGSNIRHLLVMAIL